MTYTELKYEKKTVEKVLVFMNRLREEFPLNKNVQESWRCCLVVEYFLTVSQAAVSITITEKQRQITEREQMKPLSVKRVKP